jgi:Na+-translocating ferredoxin:NAD+ oxidoreductase RNF subunit RnfB
VLVPILVITAIGLVCGVAIYICYVFIPTKVKGIDETLNLAGLLPGRNCGACGYPGCFGYAQALIGKPELIKNFACALSINDNERIAKIGEALGLSIDAAPKKALPHCAGNSEEVYSYSGVNSCRGAAQLLSGNRKCPFACLGLGDCVAVCPEGAISIDPEKKVAVVDWTKCTGCGLCAKECTIGILELVSDKTKIGHTCKYFPLRNIPGRERCEFGCTHCMRCFRACENGAITWNKEKGIPEFDSSKCILCLKCIEECPTKCIEVVTLEKVPEKATA